MYKIKFAFLVLLLFSFNSFSQSKNEKLFIEKVQRFKKSTTLVQLTGDEVFDNHLRTAFQKYWKHTPVEFVTKDIVLERLPDQRYSFFAPMTFKGLTDELYDVNTKDPKDKVAKKVYSMKLFMGGITEVKYLEYPKYREYYIRAELDDYFEEQLSTIDYRLDHIIKLLSQKVEDDVHPPKTSIYDLSHKEYVNKMKERMGEIKNKTLLIQDNRLNKKFDRGNKIVVQESDFDHYPYKHKFISRDQLKELIKNEDPNYCYSVNLESTYRIYDCSGNLLYQDSNACLTYEELIKNLTKDLGK